MRTTRLMWILVLSIILISSTAIAVENGASSSSSASGTKVPVREIKIGDERTVYEANGILYNDQTLKTPATVGNRQMFWNGKEPVSLQSGEIKRVDYTHAGNTQTYYYTDDWNADHKYQLYKDKNLLEPVTVSRSPIQRNFRGDVLLGAGDKLRNVRYDPGTGKILTDDYKSPMQNAWVSDTIGVVDPHIVEYTHAGETSNYYVHPETKILYKDSEFSDKISISGGQSVRYDPDNARIMSVGDNPQVIGAARPVSNSEQSYITKREYFYDAPEVVGEVDSLPAEARVNLADFVAARGVVPEKVIGAAASFVDSEALPPIVNQLPSNPQTGQGLVVRDEAGGVIDVLIYRHQEDAGPTKKGDVWISESGVQLSNDETNRYIQGQPVDFVPSRDKAPVADVTRAFNAIRVDPATSTYLKSDRQLQSYFGSENIITQYDRETASTAYYYKDPTTGEQTHIANYYYPRGDGAQSGKFTLTRDGGVEVEKRERIGFVAESFTASGTTGEGPGIPGPLPLEQGEAAAPEKITFQEGSQIIFLNDNGEKSGTLTRNTDGTWTGSEGIASQGSDDVAHAMLNQNPDTVALVQPGQQSKYVSGQAIEWAKLMDAGYKEEPTGGGTNILDNEGNIIAVYDGEIVRLTKAGAKDFAEKETAAANAPIEDSGVPKEQKLYTGTPTQTEILDNLRADESTINKELEVVQRRISSNTEYIKLAESVVTETASKIKKLEETQQQRKLDIYEEAELSRLKAQQKRTAQEIKQAKESVEENTAREKELAAKKEEISKDIAKIGPIDLQGNVAASGPPVTFDYSRITGSNVKFTGEQTLGGYDIFESGGKHYYVKEDGTVYQRGFFGGIGSEKEVSGDIAKTIKARHDAGVEVAKQQQDAASLSSTAKGTETSAYRGRGRGENRPPGAAYVDATYNSAKKQWEVGGKPVNYVESFTAANLYNEQTGQMGVNAEGIGGDVYVGDDGNTYAVTGVNPDGSVKFNFESKATAAQSYSSRLESRDQRKEATFQLYFRVLNLIMGPAVQRFIKEKCEGDWTASKTENSVAVTTQGDAGAMASQNPCASSHNLTSNIHVTSYRSQPPAPYDYITDFGITACNPGYDSIAYKVYQNHSIFGEEMLKTGSVLRNQEAIERIETRAAIKYDRVCIWVSDETVQPNPHCTSIELTN